MDASIDAFFSVRYRTLKVALSLAALLDKGVFRIAGDASMWDG
jgi:hypothetical protein